MVASKDTTHAGSRLPVYSLYGPTRVPTAGMLEEIDVLIVDLQDVGTRVYTFIYTLSHCMEAAAAHQKKVVILDRPNPLGGEQIEGNCLSPHFSSFVGRYPIPMRHGLTMGEFGRMINQHCKINCDLEVIAMDGWRRSLYFDETDLPWIAPSPNMPTLATALVYPGQVIWEGTNISEGRGTTLPFELWGAPFINTIEVQHVFEGYKLPGVQLRPTGFEPVFDKWQNELCQGFQLHVTDRKSYCSYTTSLILLETIWRTHPEHFKWIGPPYEYDYTNHPIDLIVGTDQVRQGLTDNIPIMELTSNWASEVAEYRQWRKPYLLYE